MVPIPVDLSLPQVTSPPVSNPQRETLDHDLLHGQAQAQDRVQIVHTLVYPGTRACPLQTHHHLLLFHPLDL